MGKQQPFPSLPPPLLLTSHYYQSEEQSFYNLLENRYHTTRIPILRNATVICSAYGWLVLLDQTDTDSGGECCLWNPTSLEIIQLPVVNYARNYFRCFLSKPPTDPDCFVLFNHFSTMDQIFCRIGDNAFYESDLFERGYSLVAMASFKGIIYGILRPRKQITKYEFVTIHMTDGKIETKPLLIDGERPWEVLQPVPSWVEMNHDYLIESPCGSELLLVIKMTFNRDTRLHFRIFRVDPGRMVCEELDDLDGRTIFINFNGNGFCRSSESFGTAMKPNSVYYTNEFGMVMYVYDVEDRSTISLLPYPDAYICPCSGSSSWVDLPDIPMKNSFSFYV